LSTGNTCAGQAELKEKLFKRLQPSKAANYKSSLEALNSFDQ
jgi:hypothetical protein